MLEDSNIFVSGLQDGSVWQHYMSAMDVGRYAANERISTKSMTNSPITALAPDADGDGILIGCEDGTFLWVDASGNEVMSMDD